MANPATTSTTARPQAPANGRRPFPFSNAPATSTASPAITAASGGTLEQPSPRIRVISHGRLTWVDIERATSTEIEWLGANYPDFHPLDLDDCLSKIQRPKIDEYDDYLFIVLHFPVFNRALRMTVPSEVDIFVGAGYIITLHQGDLRPLNGFFQDCRGDEGCRHENMGRSAGFLLYQIIDRLVDYCFPILNKISTNIDEVEDKIFEDETRAIVRELSMIRRDVIAYRRIIKPQIAIIASLEHKERPFLREDLDVYWGNISDHVNRIWDILEDHREVIEGLAATSESFNSLRMNEIMKVLTLISTIMLPMAVISGIYGMNIDFLPFAHAEYSFVITVGFMLATAVGFLSYFRHRRWI